MADKLAHIVVENTTYDIQDEELTSRINGLTLSLTLTNDFQIKATLTDSIGKKTFESNTIDLPSEDSITELAYDSEEKEIIAKHRNDTASSQWQRVSLASIIDGLQQELTAGNNISIESNTISVTGLGEASTASTTGIATLDSGGKVPTSQLPSFVDDVLEYSSLSNFPEIGESGKIYVALDDNKTYRWSGSTYVEISQGVVLGETDHTAYRGDRGKTAYDHATETKIGVTQTGLYKISTTAQGHVASLTAVQKSDITALGIPGQDTSSYLDLTDKPLSVDNGDVIYTLSDGLTTLTLAQESDLANVAFSGNYTDLSNKPTIPTSYNDLTDKPTIPTIIFRQWSTE